jgi:hypothetical protein
MAGVAQRSKLPGLASVFFGAPQTSLHDFGARKMFDAAECPKKIIVADVD